MRGPSVRGAGRLARGGVLEQYGEHGKQAQRSNGGPIMCFARQLVRNAGSIEQFLNAGGTLSFAETGRKQIYALAAALVLAALRRSSLRRN